MPMKILKFIAIRAATKKMAALEGYTGRNGMFDQGLSELNTVVKYLADFGVPAENFAVDLTIARGLDYYTGTVMRPPCWTTRRSAPCAPAAV